MDTRLELSKEFKDKVLNHFKSSNKTSWGKNELREKVMELWTEFLEEELERKDRLIAPYISTDKSTTTPVDSTTGHLSEEKQHE